MSGNESVLAFVIASRRKQQGSVKSKKAVSHMLRSAFLMTEIEKNPVGLDRFPQLFAWFELDHVAGLDLDGCPGLGISAGPGFAPDFLKSAEAHQCHLAVLFLQ